MGKRTVRERSAIEYHLDNAMMATANALEYAQGRRSNVLPNDEYAELEAAGLIAVYMVLLEVSGFTDDPERQKRIMDRARKLASEKLNAQLEVEATDDGHQPCTGGGWTANPGE